MSRIDKPPGQMARLLYRAPIYLYRWGLGPVMGRRLLMLTHTGRKSGEPRYAVLEVARHGDDGVFYVPAAYGRNADWYLNLSKTPEAKVNHRGKTIAVTAETLSVERAVEEFAIYARSHPRAARNLGKVMDIPFDEPEAVASKIPLVALTPHEVS